MRQLTKALLAVFALALGWAPLSASAAEDEDATQNPHLLKAKAEYQSFEFESAREELQKAKRWPANTIKDLATTHLYEGLTLAQLGDFQSSKVSFRVALCLYRRAKVPADTSPKIKEIFLAARNELKKEGIKACENLDLPGMGTFARQGKGGQHVGTLGPTENPYGTYAWIGVAAGGALLATGAALLVASNVAINEARAEDTVHRRAFELRESAETQGAAGIATLATGAVLALAGGMTLLLWSPPPGRVDEPGPGQNPAPASSDGRLGAAPLPRGGGMVTFDLSF